MGAAASRKKPPVVLDDADDDALFNAAFTNKVLNACYLDTRDQAAPHDVDAKLSCECGAYSARYGSLVFRGLPADEPTKPCQDRYGLVDNLFLILDGHGPHGHACAQFCLEELPRSFDEAQGSTVEERLVEASVKTNSLSTSRKSNRATRALQLCCYL